MLNRSFQLIIFGSFAFLVLFCGKNDLTEPSDVLKIKENLTSHDKVNRTITTQQEIKGCQGDSLISSVIEVNYSYIQKGDSLFLWKSGECGAGLFKGNSPTVMGQWTTRQLIAVEIPAESRPTHCQDSISSTIFSGYMPEGELAGINQDSLFLNQTLTADISPSSISFSYDTDFCLAQSTADQYGQQFAILIGIVERNCEQVKIKNKLKPSKTAVLTSTMIGQELNLTFEHDTTICSATQNINPNTPPTSCPATEPTKLMEYFQACILKSGFIDLNF